MAKYSAFTLLEIVVVLGIIVMVVTIVTPLSVNQLQNSNAESSAKDLASSLFLMQQNSYNYKASGNYGVLFESSEITIYEGISFASAVWSEEIEFKGSVQATATLANSTNEIKFVPGSLLPDTNGYVTISSSGNTFRVTINKEGMIEIIEI